jgi:dCMP deaminase
LECAKLIIQAGIKRVIFYDSYHHDDGINLLKKANIEVLQVEIESSNQDTENK